MGSSFFAAKQLARRNKIQDTGYKIFLDMRYSLSKCVLYFTDKLEFDGESP